MNSKSKIRYWLARTALAIVAWGLVATPCPAQDASEPLKIVRETLDKVIEILARKDLSAPERAKEVEQLARDRFDIETMSRLVLARRWKDFSPEQREEFVGEFETRLAETYGARITRYEQDRVDILGHRFEPRGDLTVMTRVVGGTADGIEIDYRLRERNGEWRVIDVVIEGVSLVASYRAQFSEILARGGPKELLKLLREKNANSEA
jgi:phospholipid transport system substrate-binding protein